MLDFNHTPATPTNISAICQRLNDRIVDLAHHFFGSPNAALSNGTELRFGTHGSLSVEPSTGRWYSHEEKTGGAALELISFHSKVDRDAAAQWASQWLGMNVVRLETSKRERAQDQRRRFVAAYPYTDERHQVLFEAVKYEVTGSARSKTFRMRRPDNRGGWIWNTKNVRLVPYRLPELIDAVAGGERVFIAEGEKDCDALAALGLTATTNPSGVGKWRAEFTPFFAGADVVILPDADEAGQKHAEEVAAGLRGTAAAVRIVQLPGLPEKGDVSDWIAAGGTAEALKKLCENNSAQLCATSAQPNAEGCTPQEQPEPPPDAKPDRLGIEMWSWQDPTAIPPRPWLLGNFAMRGEVSAIGGMGGRGKTAWLIGAMLSGVTGRNLVGQHPHRRGRWLFLDLEDNADEFRRRVSAAMMHHDIAPEEVEGRIFHRTIPGGLIIARENGADVVADPIAGELKAFVIANEIEAIVVDPMVTTYVGDENSNKTVDAVTRIWKEIAAATDAAVILSHHFRKGSNTPGDADAFRGGSALIGATRAAFTITRMTADEGKALGIEADERDRFIRLDNAKTNMARGGRETWYRMASVDLDNGSPEYPNGDQVQVIETWTPPDAFQDLSTSTCREVVLAIDAGMDNGDRYTDARSKTNTRWAGNVIMELAGKTEAEAIKILSTWIKNGVLEARNYRSEAQRKNCFGLWANHTNLPGTHHDG